MSSSRKQCLSLALKEYKQGPEAKQSISVACMVKKNAVGESSQRAGWHEYGIENADVTYVGTQ